MATRVFLDKEPAQLRGFAELGWKESIRFFILAAADRMFVDLGRGRSPKDRLGLTVQLCLNPIRACGDHYAAALQNYRPGSLVMALEHAAIITRQANPADRRRSW